MMPIFFAGLIFCAGAFAAPKAKSVVVEVKIGDRHSLFVVEAPTEKKDGKLSFSNNAGKNSLSRITKSDYEVIEQKLKSLPKKNNDLKLCPQDHIKITSPYGTRIACASSQTTIAKRMRVFVNGLSASIR